MLQHICMRAGALNVTGSETSVKGFRGGKTLNKGIGGLLKSASPHFLPRFLFSIAHGPVFLASVRRF
jgi:hypothetical protein